MREGAFLIRKLDSPKVQRSESERQVTKITVTAEGDGCGVTCRSRLVADLAYATTLTGQLSEAWWGCIGRGTTRTGC